MIQKSGLTDIDLFLEISEGFIFLIAFKKIFIIFYSWFGDGFY